MKTPTPKLALVACLLGLAGGCVKANPAFLVEPREPSPARVTDGGGDRGATLDLAPDQASPAPAPDAPLEPDGPEASMPDASQDVAAEPDLVADATADLTPDQAPDSSLTAGLLVRYPLDLTPSSAVPDDTGARAGSMHGGSAWTNLGFPGAQFANGGALALDGSSGYVTLPVAGLPSAGASKSISLWFWQPAPSTGLRKTLLALSNPDEAVGLQIGLQGGVPSVWVWAQLIGTAIVAGNETSPGGWTHLVFVQQSATQRLYVNGRLADSSVFLMRSAPITSFMLGGYAPTGGEDERWSGRIDDVRIYGRVLTAAEISALAAGAP